MQNKLKGWLADNTVTADENDKILILENALRKAARSVSYPVFIAQQGGEDDRPVIE